MERDRSPGRTRATIRPGAVKTHTLWQVRESFLIDYDASLADRSESSMNHGYVLGVSVLAVSLGFAPGVVGAKTSSISAATPPQIRELYRALIEAENNHDIEKVRAMVWDSPEALFVAKTKTAAEGNWAGFWGKEIVVEHIQDLFTGTFRIDPDYSKEKIALLAPTVAETYIPVEISVAYAGQSGTPKPFLMIIEWVRVSSGAWKMATDIALPIPPPPK
jgi:hypothetical protein